MLVSERRVVLVLRRERVRVLGHEAAELELLLEVIIADEPILVVGRRVGREEDRFGLVTRTSRHCLDDLAVGVLLTTRRVEHFLWRARAVDFRNNADDHVASRLD